MSTTSPTTWPTPARPATRCAARNSRTCSIRAWSQPGASAGQQTTVPTGLQLGLGTRAASNEIIFTQGNFSETDNPLDVVIQGNGFFQVRRATGEIAYTRAGTFQLDKTATW